MEKQQIKTQVFNVVILDRSGSMSSLRKAAIDGFNETLAGIQQAQRNFHETQDHFVSLVTFCSCEMKAVFDKVPVADAKPLRWKDYEPCCCTPLYDAMGFTINSLRKHVANIKDAAVVVTVITDGEENASREYSGFDIQQLVKQLREEGWTFSYIGANQDAVEVAVSLSISHASNFTACEGDTRFRMRRENASRNNYFDRLHKMKICQAPGAALSKTEHAALFEMAYEEEARHENRYTPDNIQSLAPNEVFVFGSNLQGKHIGGAARVAVKKFGAVMGEGVGLHGQSYAIPTMHGGVDDIKPYVDEFIHFAHNHPELTFYVTRIGCGIAGFHPEEIADLFRDAVGMRNVILPEEFVMLIRNYWK